MTPESKPTPKLRPEVIVPERAHGRARLAAFIAACLVIAAGAVDALLAW